MATTQTQWSEDDLIDFVFSARYGDIEEVQACLDKNIPMTARDGNGNTALHMAAANGHLNVVQLLLPKCSQADLDAGNEAKSTPLHWAALNGHKEIVMLLCDAGANTNIPNEADHSALFEALNNEKQEVADYLMEREAAEAAAGRSNGDDNLVSKEGEEEGKEEEEDEDED